MSRSYKKNPFFIVPKNKAFFKKYANKKVRNCFVLADGKAYKKVFNSYDIIDWRFYSPNDEKAYRK